MMSTELLDFDAVLEAGARQVDCLVGLVHAIHAHACHGAPCRGLHDRDEVDLLLSGEAAAPFSASPASGPEAPRGSPAADRAWPGAR